MLTRSLLVLASLACMAAAHPIQPDEDHQWMLVRTKRSPMAARTMILVRGQPTNAGYHYAKPDRTFNPRAGMAAYATDGTVATGSFYGAPSQKQRCGDCNEQPEPPQPDDTETKAVEPPAAPEEVEEEVVPERKPKAPKAPKGPSKRRPVKEDDDEDDDDDDDDDGSVYRNFFPMMFGGGGSRGRLRAADDEGGDANGGHGPVTAIANSFSQGRRAIASSSAVAHGRPDPSQKSQQSRYRARA